jgi:Flp pilus assembly pilin Flp
MSTQTLSRPEPVAAGAVPRLLGAVLAALVALPAGLRRVARDGREAGASAIEFAIIAAVVVVAASVIGGIVYNIVSDKSNELQQCANQPVGAAACAGGAGTGAGNGN